MNKTKNGIAALLIAGFAFPALAQAGPKAGYDYAKVVDVTPITRSVEISTPEHECWYEEVPRYSRNEGSTGSALLGGIVGGVVGNRFGGGDGKKVATVAGTLAGAMIGRELSRGPDEYRVDTEERCRTVNHRRIEERVIGYDVRYRYNGQEYVTRTDRDPGKRLRVRVSVTPVL